jgi:hypothetical protein
MWKGKWKIVVTDGTPKTSIFYRSVFKYASVSQQLIAPILIVPMLMGAISCQQKYLLLLDCRLGRTPWQTRMVSGWRGYVWAPKKSGAFRDKSILLTQISAGIIWRGTPHTQSHLCTWTARSTRCIFASKQYCLKTLMEKRVATKNCF